ncbi:MAG: hypothetical protein RR595_11600 [Lysinibacillus sp.]
MKIQAFTVPLLHNNTDAPAQLKSKSNEAVTEEEKQIRDPKVILQESILKQLSEMKEAKMKTGKGDSKAERIITKFDSGKKLSSDELSYLIKNAPASVDRILRMSAEREQNEMMMRMARTKSDTLQVPIYAANAIKKTSQSAGDALTRTNQLQDAVHEYQKTDEYKEKPNTASDIRTKKKSKKPILYAESALWTAAKNAYLPRKTNISK